MPDDLTPASTAARVAYLTFMAVALVAVYGAAAIGLVGGIAILLQAPPQTTLLVLLAFVILRGHDRET